MNPRILVIDDNEDILTLLKRKLTPAGFYVETVVGGEAGLETLKSEKDNFDVILLDQMMPGMDGMTTFDKIKESACKAPVVMLTAFGSLSLAVAFLRMGGADFMEKPVEVDVLAVKLNNIIKISQANCSMRQLEDEKVALNALIEMTGEIVHEINNPLNTIFTAVSILDEKYSDDYHTEIVGKMKNSMNSIHQAIVSLENVIEERKIRFASLP